MPDYETQPPREDAVPGDAPHEDAEQAPSWSTPAAAPVPDEPAATPRAEPRSGPPRDEPASGGWFGRLRSLVRREPVEPPPPAAPWRSPGAAEPAPPSTPAPTPAPTAGFEAPARPVLADDTPLIDAPLHTPPAGGFASLPASTPSPAPAAEPVVEAPTAPDVPTGEPAEEAATKSPAAVIPEPPTPAPAAPTWRFGQFITTQPATEPEPGPEPAAPVAEPMPAQPSLFHTPPAEHQPVIEDLEEALPSAEVTARAIEDAIDEATATIEHPQVETPEEADFPPVPPLTVIAEDLPLPDPDAESAEEIAEEEREAELIAKGGPFSRFAWPSHPRYWNGFLAVLTGLVTLSILMFVLVEPSPRWILVVVALGVAAGMDGVLRATWRGAFARGEDTTPYLFLPAAYVFAAPLLIEHNVTGHTVVLWGLIAGIGFGAIAVAEVLSVRTGSWLYPYARMVTTGAAYFAAFSLLAMTYVLGLGLVPAFVATWLIGTMLAIEVVREGEVDPVETAVFAGLVGLVLAQVRWLLFYLPLDGYLAGLALVLVFYFVTGVLHSYVVRQLNTITASEYALVTVIGMVLVGAARVAGLA